MKAKKLLCLGMAGIIICSNLRQISVHAQETTNMEIEYGEETVEAVYAESTSTEEDGFEIEDGALVEYSGTDTEIVIPDGITEIGDFAFNGCSSLTSITIPESVTAIGYNAFIDYESNIALIVTPDSYAEKYAKESDVSYHYSEEGGHAPSHTNKVTTQSGGTTKGIRNLFLFWLQEINNERFS